MSARAPFDLYASRLTCTRAVLACSGRLRRSNAYRPFHRFDDGSGTIASGGVCRANFAVRALLLHGRCGFLPTSVAWTLCAELVTLYAASSGWCAARFAKHRTKKLCARADRRVSPPMLTASSGVGRGNDGRMARRPWRWRRRCGAGMQGRRHRARKHETLRLVQV